MIMKIKELLIKYKELIVYVLFGAATTLVNFAVYKVCNLILGEELYLVSNIVAWFASVIFAYVTNKLWVFESKSWSSKVILKEIPSFFAARVFSFAVEEVGLFLLVDVMGFESYSIEISDFTIGGNMIAKVILAFVVVVLNYLFSKLFIFRKKEK